MAEIKKFGLDSPGPNMTFKSKLKKKIKLKKGSYSMGGTGLTMSKDPKDKPVQTSQEIAHDRYEAKLKQAGISLRPSAKKPKPDKEFFRRFKKTEKGEAFAKACCGYFVKKKKKNVRKESPITFMSKEKDIGETWTHAGLASHKELGIPGDGAVHYVRDKKNYGIWNKGKDKYVTHPDLESHPEVERRKKMKKEDLEKEWRSNDETGKWNVGDKAKLNPHLGIKGSVHIKDFAPSGKFAVVHHKKSGKTHSVSVSDLIEKSEPLLKAFEDRWILEIGDELRKLTAAHQLPFEFLTHPEGNVQNYIFKVGDCEVIYSIMGKDAKMRLNHPEKPVDLHYNVAKHLYNKLQQAHQPLAKVDGTEEFMAQAKQRAKAQAKVKETETKQKQAKLREDFWAGKYSANVKKTDDDKARKRWISGLKAKGHEEKDLHGKETHVLRDMHVEEYPETKTHTRSGGPKGTGFETKTYTQRFGIKKTEKGELLKSKLYGGQYTSIWGESHAEQDTRREKRSMSRKLRGRAIKKPLKSTASRRLADTNRRLFGGMKEKKNVGKSLEKIGFIPAKPKVGGAPARSKAATIGAAKAPKASTPKSTMGTAAKLKTGAPAIKSLTDKGIALLKTLGLGVNPGRSGRIDAVKPVKPKSSNMTFRTNIKKKKLKKDLAPSGRTTGSAQGNFEA